MSHDALTASAQLVAKLLESLKGEPAVEVERAWIEELEHRAKEDLADERVHARRRSRVRELRT